MFKSLRLLGVLLVGAIQLASPATGQEFPRKQPVRIIVPVPAGGGTDILARITADALQRRLGQSVIVENKPGASSTIGADFVARSPADGYTLLFTGSEFAVVPAVRTVPYGFDDFTYLVRGFSFPNILVASPKYPGSSLQELLADMKARPGQVRYGSTGVGAIVHVGISMLEGAVGVKGLHVPYQGIAPVYKDLLAGEIDFTEALPPFQEGFKLLAATGTRRHPAYPNVATLEEAGIKGATWETWFGFLAPAKLPKPIADRLIAEITAVLKDPATLAQYEERKLPADPAPLTGDAFRTQVLQDGRNWKAVVERAKIVVQ